MSALLDAMMFWYAGKAVSRLKTLYRDHGKVLEVGAAVKEESGG